VQLQESVSSGNHEENQRLKAVAPVVVQMVAVTVTVKLSRAARMAQGPSTVRRH
jgi:hypothetical protein